MFPEDLSQWPDRQIDDFVLLMNLEAAEQDRKYGDKKGGGAAAGSQSAADTEAVFQKMREQQKQREASAGGL